MNAIIQTDMVPTEQEARTAAERQISKELEAARRWSETREQFRAADARAFVVESELARFARMIGISLEVRPMCED